jgi:hypothetical protein
MFYAGSLAVSKTGTGSGSVTSAPAGIDCGSTCEAGFAEGKSVTLTATPDASSTFTSWSGDCSGTGPCVITMTESSEVSATFTLKSYNLTVQKAGNGSGGVTGAPANPIVYGTVVTLTASADPGSTFAGWSGACSGTGACVVIMTQARSVTATFTLIPPNPTYTLTVNTDGDGTGSVTGAPANPIAQGTVVTLTAQAASGSEFTGWSGDCTGTALCVLTMTSAKTVTATFTLQGGGVDVEVNIAPAGPGGTVTVELVSETGQAGAANMPVRIGQTDDTYPVGTVLRLTATPWLGYSFDGWGGDASGTQNPLEVTVSVAVSITAAFSAAEVYLPSVGR